MFERNFLISEDLLINMKQKTEAYCLPYEVHLTLTSLIKCQLYMWNPRHDEESTRKTRAKRTK